MMTNNTTYPALAYFKKFGLSKNPFPVAPDDADFYLSAAIEEIIAEIVHGICTRKGFLMLTGDVGLGKTTITRRILKILESRQIRTSLVFHTSLKDVDLLREINRDFGLPVDTSTHGDHLGSQLQQLNDFLVDQYANGKNCVLIIDDAQNLDRSSLELVRMISNLEVDQQKIVQILLVGQPELLTTLKSRAMRQLFSRIVIRKIVRPLSREALRSYIQFKLNSAGNQGRITLTASAYRRLYREAKGNFRMANLIMDRCLYAMCSGSGYRITRETMNLAVNDLQPEKPGRRSALAWAASVLVPVVIAMGTWSAHLYTSSQSMADNTVTSRSYKVPKPLPSALQTPPPARKIQGAAPMVKPVNSAIAEFLRIYRLERFAPEFQRGIEIGLLESVSQRIYAETGYQLIKLSALPNRVKKRYGALSMRFGAHNELVWLLFWKPKLELRRFYYDYQGEEIFKLQSFMKDLQLYEYELDGIVGGRLTQALIAFQEKTGLPMTGFPDPVTLFWVCHQQEAISNG